MASYLRIEPDHGSIEVGHINYSPLLQNSVEGTETMYLMMKNAFEVLGNRRYEWKCNNLNSSSKKAALRLGFKFEGVFRQMFIFKGRSRDSAWFSILDKEWPKNKKRFLNYLKKEEKSALDVIAIACEMPTSKAAYLLLNLELKGVCRPLPGKEFELV